jgi:hypothetical protein
LQPLSFSFYLSASLSLCLMHAPSLAFSLQAVKEKKMVEQLSEV